jgi:aspartokinase/homoserine dehydrogenase 1
MKFGGSSLANAERLHKVAVRVAERAASTRVGLVVSAVGGVTNQLVRLLELACSGQDTMQLQEQLQQQHLQLLQQLKPELATDTVALLHTAMQQCFAGLAQDLNGVCLLRACPEEVQARILAIGEQIAVCIVDALLRAQGLTVERIEPSALIRTCGSLLEAQPLLPEIAAYGTRLKNSSAQVLLLPGFIGADANGSLSLLGRNGSDYSSALFAYALDAELCEIWTDVDGVYSADPRLVANAQLIAALSYEEAMELSYFGAKVLHPKTISPLMLKRIPLRIRNTLNPDSAGTCIGLRQPIPLAPAQGLTLLQDLSLITVSGPGMQGVPGMAARLFAAVARAQISIPLITQASSECSLSFAVAAPDEARALSVLECEFVLERQSALLRAFEPLRNVAILSLVGDGLYQQQGIAGRFFAALATIRVNVIAISQGSSERSISAVIADHDSQRALRGVHQQFFESRQVIEVFLLGVGTVGRALLKQFATQQPFLRAHGIDLRLCGIANSKKMRLDSEGFAPDGALSSLDNGVALDIDQLLQFVNSDGCLNPVLVDCTSDTHIAQAQLRALQHGLHVVTANKKANTLSMAFYQALRQSADHHSRRYLYETNVGAALPVIDTLQNLIKSGDTLRAFVGILSGSLSHVFGLLNDGVPFSEAVRDAETCCFTEPDPRDDLSGLDVARKLLILMREAGMAAELEDISRESIFPAMFDSSGSLDRFRARLPQINPWFAASVQALQAANKVLRFVGEIRDGKARVGLLAVDADHPLYPIRNGENALVFYTHRYDPVPLVIRGYGAGADVTAGGVFADILRTVTFHPARGGQYSTHWKALVKETIHPSYAVV